MRSRPRIASALFYDVSFREVFSAYSLWFVSSLCYGCLVISVSTLCSSGCPRGFAVYFLFLRLVPSLLLLVSLWSAVVLLFCLLFDLCVRCLSLDFCCCVSCLWLLLLLVVVSVRDLYCWSVSRTSFF